MRTKISFEKEFFSIIIFIYQLRDRERDDGGIFILLSSDKMWLLTLLKINSGIRSQELYSDYLINVISLNITYLLFKRECFIEHFYSTIFEFQQPSSTQINPFALNYLFLFNPDLNYLPFFLS